MARFRSNLNQLSLFDIAPDVPEPPAAVSSAPDPVGPPPPPVPVPAPTTPGEKAKAHDILAAIRTLKVVEAENRAATPYECESLSRFCGFGPVALSLFPDPIKGTYKYAAWQKLGEELRDMLTPDE